MSLQQQQQQQLLQQQQQQQQHTILCTCIMLLLDKLSFIQIPVAAKFENADLRNASSGCERTNI